MPDFGDVNPDTGVGSARTGFEGTVDPLAPSVANGQISPEQWAEYQKQRKRAFITGLLGTVGGMGAAGFIPGLIGGGGAAAGSAGAASLPPAATAGMLPPSMATGALGAGGAGAGASIGAASGAAGSAAKNFLGLSPRDWMTLIPALAGTVGTAVQGSPNMAPNTQTQDPNLQRLIQTMQGRLNKSEPLYDSIMAMANGLLPTQYQKGGGGMP